MIGIIGVLINNNLYSDFKVTMVKYLRKKIISGKNDVENYACLTNHSIATQNILNRGKYIV